MPVIGRGGPRRRRPSPPSPAQSENSRFLAIGEVQAPHGVRGHFRARILTDFPDRFKRLRHVYLGEEHQPFEVESARVLPEGALIKLRGIETPEVARTLAHKLLYVPEAEAEPLGEDQFYWYQIIGLAVWTQDERYLGEVKDILSTGSNDVYVVQGPLGEILVPAIEDVVVAVDVKAGRLVIEPMEGML
ncbi:MAG: ribosome maturation factor RimM [Chloroflexota bacterium]